MKLKNSYFFTLREDVKDEESISGKLLVRSGMIKKSSAGVYMYLPLGFKVLENVKNIIRDEMNKSGALELLMPSLISEDYFITSKRIDKFGDDMFSLKDRYNKKFALGPTHEELFTVAALLKINSYKDLPLNLYQIGNKFRDEIRPRFGLIRVREFLMKDAYSFDINDEECEKSYKKMYKAYNNIFDRCDLKYRVVKSDTGAMGGSLSEEYQALTEIGEDIIVNCSCGYSSNTDIATSYFEEKDCDEKELKKELVNTPNCKTIEEVSSYLSENSDKFIKSLVYKYNKGFVCTLVCGTDDVNETKLSKILDSKVELASEEEINKLNTITGFVGPIDLNIKIIGDFKIKNMKNFIVGANKKDYHYKNVGLNDFKVSDFYDITVVKEGDLCPLCKNKLNFSKGIEVGNIFKLGTKYSEAFNMYYLNEKNERKPVVMGCYGIGLGRIIAAVIEGHNDDKGILWPYELAPYKVSIVVVNTNDKEQLEKANTLYEDLTNLGIDTLLDDRDERVGVKFNDMDLIGIPIRITIGKKANEDIFEFKKREEKEFKEMKKNEIIDYFKNIK